MIKNTLNFNPSNYDKNHNFIDCSLTECIGNINEFEIYYDLICNKCNLGVFHYKIASNQRLFVYKSNRYMYINSIYETYNDIDYSKIYSCSEMIIKNLLE